MDETAQTDAAGLGHRAHAPGHGQRVAVRGFLVVLLFLLAFAIFFYKNFHRVVVSGQSMEPTLHDGQQVWVSKAYWLIGPIRKKDIVVLHDTGPTGYIIKRVYKMGGEQVDWANAPENHSLKLGPYVVPDGDVYVLGDNRMHSEDSRKFGPIDTSEILGKVVVVP